MAPYGAGAETCGDFRRGLCTRGDRCRYIHGDAEGNAGSGYGGHGSHPWYGHVAAGTWSPWDSGDRTGSWGTAGQHMGNWAAAAARLEAHAVAAAAAEPARVIALQELLLPEQLPAAVAQPAGAAAAVAPAGGPLRSAP